MPYLPHEHMVTPPDDTVLWRYMDFARFLQLLETKCLWLSRVDQFDDPLEAALTDGEVYTRGSPDETPQWRDVTGDPIAKLMRATTYVNCWHIGSSESLAMWDLYGKGSGIVAVMTTVAALKRELAADLRPIFMAHIQYVDWRSPNVLRNMLNVVTRKDDSYKHESEMRLIFWDVEGPKSRDISLEDRPTGQPLPINPQRLIAEIWVGPREKSWIVPLVESVVTRYGLNIPIRASEKLMKRRRMLHR